jgi:hypothetical protein
VCQNAQYLIAGPGMMSAMASKAKKNLRDAATLRSVKKEMAEPRMALSTRIGEVVGRASGKKRKQLRSGN